MAAGLVLATVAPVAAQTGPVDDKDGSPAREGNVYEHRDHQPTESEVGRAEGKSGVDYPNPTSDQEVERGVENLLRQTDEMDEEADTQGRNYPAGSSSQPSR
jgi:hypothetical protein